MRLSRRTCAAHKTAILAALEEEVRRTGVPDSVTVHWHGKDSKKRALTVHVGGQGAVPVGMTHPDAKTTVMLRSLSLPKPESDRHRVGRTWLHYEGKVALGIQV